MREGIRQLYEMRKNFAIIGLTGRTGSGCTTVAKALLDLPKNHDVVASGIIDKQGKNERREWDILSKYYTKNPINFYHIQIKNIIATFILEFTFEELDEYFKKEFKINITCFKEKYNEFHTKNKVLDGLFVEGYNIESFLNQDIDRYVFEELDEFVNEFRKAIEMINGCATSIFQKIGDNIRKTGCALKDENGQYEFVFSISRRLNTFIKVIRRIDREKNKFSFYIIDAFRNPLEVHFFRERYSAFYLLAVNCTDKIRKERLVNLDLNKTAIETIDKKEKGNGKFYTNYSSHIGQDIQECVGMADLYINNENDSNPYKPNLKRILTKYMVLIQHPGLIKPTRHEFIMQTAINAAANSGCISRNVGAVITDSKFNPLAIGWNCVPEHQVPCFARDIEKLVSRTDETAFSDFEKNTDFCDKVKNRVEKLTSLEEYGLPKNFCFKSEYNKIKDEKNQVHTRALHAEENTVLQCAKLGVKAEGGFLFTSASPCVLCAKKICQLGIKEIFYMDPYPDISESHVFGYVDARVKMTLFTGAVGIAYQKLYTPLLPIKDEIEALTSTEKFA